MERSVIGHLLVALAGPLEPATRQPFSAGYTEAKIRGAWNAARASRFTERRGSVRTG